MRICATFAALLGLLTTVGCAGGSGEVRPIPATEIQGILDAAVSDEAPGLLCAVRTPAGTWTGAAGVADRETSAPMTADMQIRIGSNSKQFLAALVLQLRDEGALALTDTVERWLPGVVPNGERVTIAMLLNHTSGLPDYTETDEYDGLLLSDPTRAWTPAELLALAFTHEPTGAPGAACAYTNTGYIVLGMVVEAVTDSTVEEELRTRLFTPLGLTRTRFATGAELDAPYAHGYIALEEGGDLTDVEGLSPSSAGFAGAILSTGEDVLDWTTALFGGEVLPNASLQEMLTPIAPATDYGFGIAVMETDFLGERSYWHDGGFPGYYSQLLHMPESRITVFTATNRYPDSEEALSNVSNAVVAELLGKEL